MKRMILIMLSATVFAVPALAEDDDHRHGVTVHRGQVFKAVLSGAQEVPGNESRAFGVVTARFDPGFTRVFVNVELRGLEGDFRASHFHCNLAGANGPIGLGLQSPGPLMFDGKRLRGVLTNADFPDPENCMGVIGRPVNNVASLAFAMREGLIYINVHSSDFPPGEVRGQMLQAR